MTATNVKTDVLANAFSQDIRPNIAGYPLPFAITTDPIMGEDVVDADGQQIINFADEEDGDFYKELIAKVNRATELEASLIEVVDVLKTAVPNARGLGTATAKVEAIVDRLGLAR